MTGTLVNVVAIIAGSIIGMMFRNKLPQRIITSVFQTIGLFTLALGVMMFLKVEHIIAIVFSLIVGTIVGSALDLDRRIEALTLRVQSKYHLKEDRFSEGLLTSFMIFCMGSMTVIGAIDEGIGNGSELLLIKSLMDGFASIALGAAMGVGVTMSVIPLFLYQGGITLFAMWLGKFISNTTINNLTATGGVILVGLGFVLLDVKKLKVLNMLPALIFVILFSWLMVHFKFGV